MPLSSLDPRWFHRQVALVAQEPVLFARTIEENITYGLENGGGGGEGATAPGSEEVVRAARLANAHDFIGTFEHAYETVVGERGTQLSGGQKQRVAIARALVRRPAVLLLDEATSALDAESEAVVQAAIDSMIEQGGMTVLVVAHRLSTIRNADRIVIISAGAVKESGKHDELLALKGEYANLVARQMHPELARRARADGAREVASCAAENFRVRTDTFKCAQTIRAIPIDRTYVTFRPCSTM